MVGKLGWCEHFMAELRERMVNRTRTQLVIETYITFNTVGSSAPRHMSLQARWFTWQVNVCMPTSMVVLSKRLEQRGQDTRGPLHEDACIESREGGNDSPHSEHCK